MKVEHYRALNPDIVQRLQYKRGRRMAQTQLRLAPATNFPHLHWEVSQHCQDAIAHRDYDDATLCLGYLDQLQTRYYPLPSLNYPY